MFFDLNLATRRNIDQRKVNICLSAVMLLAVATLAWNMGRLYGNMQEETRLADDIKGLESRINSRPQHVTEQEFGRQAVEIRFYNALIQRKSKDWLGLLKQLEKVTPEGVAITSFSPDGKSSEIKIEGRSRSFSQIRVFLEKLEDSKQFKNIQLNSHQELSEQNQTGGFQFGISFQVVTP